MGILIHLSNHCFFLSPHTESTDRPIKFDEEPEILLIPLDLAYFLSVVAAAGEIFQILKEG